MKQGALKLFSSVLVALALHSPAADARGPRGTFTPQYKLTQLGPLDPDRRFFAVDLNNRGELSGSVGTPSRAAIWRKGRIIELVDPTVGPVLVSQAWGLNDRGDVVGETLPLSDLMTRPFFWRRGEFIDIGLPFAGAQGFARDINNRRQIILNSGSESGVALSYLWERGTFTALNPPPGGDGSAIANALNDFGEIAGAGSTAAGIRALLWRDATVEALGVLPNTDESRAEDINNGGDVVGVSYQTTEFGNELAFVWRDGEMEALPTLFGAEGQLTQARSINVWGQIVGHEANVADPQAQQPRLWQRGRVHDLNELVRQNDPLKPFVRLRAATVINDLGQIHASGEDSRVPDVRFAYLLTPVSGRRVSDSAMPE